MQDTTFQSSLIGVVHTGQLSIDVTRMNELVPEANLPGRASEVFHMHHLKVFTIYPTTEEGFFLWYLCTISLSQ